MRSVISIDARSVRYWAIVPAAGRGRRMSGESTQSIPKQYLPILKRPMIEWSVMTLLAQPKIAGVIISLAEGDKRWQQLPTAGDSRVSTVIGGDDRAHSVMNALHALATQAQPNDWVLVHDAARPCLHTHDLARLIESLHDDDVGGLLATPVADTLKRADAEQGIATVSREHLWRALTPQMFRFEVLHRALVSAMEQGLSVTDDASAVEMLGLQPKIVSGRSDNIKVTLPEDLAIAAAILHARSMEQNQSCNNL